MHNRAKLIWMLVTGAIGVGCGGLETRSESGNLRREETSVGTTSHATGDEGDDFFIDSSVQGDDLSKLVNVMLALAPTDRENVIYQDENQHMIANRPSLLAEVTACQQNIDGTWSGPGVDPFIIPEEVAPTDFSNPNTTYPPPLYPGTGPYRRVYSKPGYSREYARISFPNANQIATLGADAAYVYMGGWTSAGPAVDAGFQYSTVYHNWAAVIKLAGQNPVAFTTRFPTGQSGNAWFAIPKDGVVQLTWTVTVSGVTQTRTFTQFAAGWKANGVGGILKRMTSIGQVPPENLNKAERILGVGWTACSIGTAANNMQLWNSVSTGGFQNYPSGPKVYVTYNSQSSEIDNIDLTR